MSSSAHDAHFDWRCHVGRHHYLVVEDDNPEMKGQSYLECSRCGKKNDLASHQPLSQRGAMGLGMGIGGG